MYKLGKNIYLTEGKTRSCIYDLNECNLYSITREDTILLKDFLQGNEELINSELIQSLINKNFIIKSNACLDDNCLELKSRIKRLSFAWIEITQRCNLRCIHCYNESSEKSNISMSLEEYKYVVDQVADLGIKRIQLIGGEPLIVGNERLKKMIMYASSKFDSIEIFTNGTLLTEDLASFFADQSIQVAVSVYSYDENKHDYVTNIQGSHERTIRCLELLRKYNVKYRTANVLMAGVELCERNTDLYKLNPNKDVIRMSGRGNANLLTRELIYKRLITEKSFTRKLNFKVIERLLNAHNCFSKNLYISADLTVYPCVMERRISHGNIKEKKLSDIIDHNILTFNKGQIDECKDCEFRLACFDCRPDSLSNDIYAKPWYCTYNPYTGEFADPDDFIDKIMSEYQSK
ncbi:radical SAM protein [Lutispora thermophila]|uniref:Radical SAM additional 4Fe4S-binding SPASM domain-containing protein n=1 Tax=Lutispora thermophila DSM 19022 TaxID=1122184 RepID=A0A1M6ETH3_9FIRM|nr:radical SAM protein [Lutispora thermophila]SHI88791.1 radical SAM additional 4Fe4S-binding SPASM domain-containing protein [Lutispora thermophila DSM 19022]